MKLNKRGDVWWIDTTIRGKRVRETLYTTDRKEAKKRALALEDALWTGRVVVMEPEKPMGPTLQKAFDECYAIRWSGKKDAKGSISRFGTLTRFIPADTPVTEINQDRVNQLVVDMLNATYVRQKDFSGKPVEGAQEYPYSRSTINRVLSQLGYILNRMEDAGHITRAPRMPKEDVKGRTRWVTEEEEKVMFDALLCSPNPNHQRCLRLFQFLTDTGCRIGEAKKLEWSQVFLDDRMIVLEDTKSGDDVGKGLTTRAYLALKSEKDEGRGKPFEGIGYTMYRKAWEYAKKAAGLEQDTALVRHSLRHTTASRLVQRGLHLKEVQEFLGHKNFNTTLRYAHLSPSGRSRAVQVLEGVT